MNWRSLLASLSAFRVPLLLGAGGVIAYSAYTSSRQRAQTVAAAQAGLTPEQAAALMAQGGQLVTAGQAPLVGLAGAGLDTASAAAAGAQGLASVALGNVGGALMALSDLAGQVVGALPSFAPFEGVAPAPTQPAPAPTQPAPAPTQPAPAPTQPARRRLRRSPATR